VTGRHDGSMFASVAVTADVSDMRFCRCSWIRVETGRPPCHGR
jgi:hypothetical protein